MSDKAIMYAADELGADELPEFTAHLHHCRFCVDLILDLRMAEQESRISADRFEEVLPALAETVNQSSGRQPAQPLTEKIAVPISKVWSFLTLPRLLVPLATACLVFVAVQSGLKDRNTVRRHKVLRSRVEMPGQNIAPPAKSPSMSSENGESIKREALENREKSSPQETLYSMTPSLKAEPESPAPAPAGKRKKRIPLSPLERLKLDRLKLVGIVRSPDGNKAIIEDHTGKGHVLVVGTYIGQNNGRVIRIEKDRVIIAAEIMDESGKVKVADIVLKLHN
jgi:type IV pilus assembly protein PilP